MMDFEDYHWIADVDSRLDKLEQWRAAEKIRRNRQRVTTYVSVAVVASIIVMLAFMV